MLKKIYAFITVVILFTCFFAASLNFAMAGAMPHDGNSRSGDNANYSGDTGNVGDAGNMDDALAPLNKRISYYVLQQSVGSAMKDIGTQVNIPVIISSNVQGKVAAGKYEGTAREILNQMVSDSNLHWYYDGRAIHVTNVKDAVMHVVQLNSFSFDTLMRTLHMIKLDTAGFPMRHDSENNLVIVYGPPKYVATVEVVAHHLANRAGRKPSVIRG
ncbi:MAG: type III secretion protein C [Alphaproteobacteria bacterium]|jgi:type III secretion protein C